MGGVHQKVKIFGILDPLPPPCPHFTQPIITVRPQNFDISKPPPPSVRTSFMYGPLGINDVTMRADSGEKISLDVVGGVCTLAGELKARLRSDCTRIHVLEVPLLPLYDLPGNEGMSEQASKINNMLRKISTQGGFEVHGWEKRLLSANGYMMPEWLISQNSVHLNAKGYDVFARLLRSLILQKGPESES